MGKWLDIVKRKFPQGPCTPRTKLTEEGTVSSVSNVRAGKQKYSPGTVAGNNTNNGAKVPYVGCGSGVPRGIGTKKGPKGPDVDEWSRLVAWARDIDEGALPPVPFELSPGITGVDRVKFLTSLKINMMAGLSGPRAKWGALQEDLRNLQKLLRLRSQDNIGGE